MLSTTARFDSKCPQCKKAIHVGEPVFRSKYDRVWRCENCTRCFEELGPSAGRYLTIADKEADHARRAEIIARYGLKETFNPEHAAC